MKKVLVSILVLLLLVGLGAWYFTTFKLDSVIRAHIEQSASQSLGTAVTVGSVKTDLRNGALTISDITVANPPGFKNANAFALRGIEASVDYSTYDVKRIIVDKPEIIIEESNGETNFTRLLEGMESKAKSAPAEEGATPPELVIHHFRMNESRAAFESPARDRYSELKVDAVEVKNVRGTPAEVAEVIMSEILEEVVSAAALELLKAKAEEKIGEIFQ